jgi:uncharacterized protein YjbI with pentapeptide repeats
MANRKHLQILRQGVEAWNTWRDLHRDIEPDLTKTHVGGYNRPLFGANLRKADLRWSILDAATLGEANLGEADLRWASLERTSFAQANLARANLSQAKLRWAEFAFANLYETNLRGADLREAHLRRADLREAALARADFSEADLRGADLRGADLSQAILGGANMGGANVSEAFLNETVFGDTNLTAVQGLETCTHVGPSTLDHRTLAKSGPLPLAFLRGCGLPDALIDYLPSLLNEPFQFYSCFISYASKDHAFAERLYADLQNNGVRCWFAPKDLPIGAKTLVSIDESIHLYDKLLLILSKSSVTSQWVEGEVATALARERQQGTTILFPVRIDNTVMALETGWPALIRNTRNIGDFRRWKKTHGEYQKAFDRLLQGLRATERQPHG